MDSLHKRTTIKTNPRGLCSEHAMLFAFFHSQPVCSPRRHPWPPSHAAPPLQPLDWERCSLFSPFSRSVSTSYCLWHFLHIHFFQCSGVGLISSLHAAETQSSVPQGNHLLALNFIVITLCLSLALSLSGFSIINDPQLITLLLLHGM